MNRRLLCLLALLPALAWAQNPKTQDGRAEAAAAPAAVTDAKTARDPNRVAVLSLLGDNVQLISLTPARGGSAQAGEWASTPAGSLDNAVLQALSTAVAASAAGREAKLYTSSTRSLFGDPAALFVDGRLSLPGKLGEAVRQSGAAQLLLVTRSRQEPALAAGLPARIPAILEGPGFVLDQRPTEQIGFDGEPGLPVLASFASIRVALVDLADLRLKREQSLAVAARLPVTRESARNPWASLSAEQRLQALQALIEAELPRALRSLWLP
ncbi:MAG: hypothetical protein IIA03_01675 [Proteobacteria bacterium]|jgi:hypothetical protein|nr:hypothetical protein [Methylibium sp.]MBY0364877.1 hypothetical protein [Burkholderiaceae bacterium]MCH8854967.1 hypothetical protein [Pseudomonadota bacterium]